MICNKKKSKVNNVIVNKQNLQHNRGIAPTNVQTTLYFYKSFIILLISKPNSSNLSQDDQPWFPILPYPHQNIYQLEHKVAKSWYERIILDIKDDEDNHVYEEDDDVLMTWNGAFKWLLCKILLTSQVCKSH